MTDIAIQIDENNRDVMYARRVEMFFEPNADGSESLNGRVVWHTEWWHYSGDLLRGKSIGPRIEKSIADVIGNVYGDLPASDIIGGINSAFIQHAREHLGIGDE